MAPVPQDELQEIRRRLEVIEQRIGIGTSAAPSPEAALPDLPDLPVPSTAGLLLLAGQAMLALAGAYLLRAFTESGSLPKLAGVVLALLYVAGWLVLVRRGTAAAPEARAIVHGVTAVGMLAPMLWETTLRLHILPPLAASGALVAFVALGLLLSTREHMPGLAVTTAAGGATTALVLMVGGGELLAFGAGLAAIALLIESGAVSGPEAGLWPGTRALAALVLNLGVLLTVVLVTRPGGLPEGYAPAPQWGVVCLLVTLAATYLTSVTVRTFVRGWRMTIFEIVQVSLALALFIWGVLATSSGGPLVAAACAATGAAAYWIAFAFVDRQQARRNFYAYTTFAIALTVTGSILLVPWEWIGAAGSAFALAAYWSGRRFDRMTLRVHGLLYLLGAAIASGLLMQASAALLGPVAGQTSPLIPAAWITAGAAVLCYAIQWGGPQVLATASAVLAFWVIGGITAGAMARWAPDPAWAATVRTQILSVGALLLAWCRTRWTLPELYWVAGLVVALAGLKLLVDDFPAGRPTTLFVSLIFFGGALTLLPRLTTPPGKYKTEQRGTT